MRIAFTRRRTSSSGLSVSAEGARVWSVRTVTTRVYGSAECPRGGCDDLVVWHVAQVLADTPAMAERIFDLPMQVTPEGLLQRLADLGAGPHRLREHRLGILD